MDNTQQLIQNGFQSSNPQPAQSTGPSLWSHVSNWFNRPAAQAPAQPVGGVNLGMSNAMSTVAPPIQNAFTQSYTHPAGPAMIQAPVVQKPVMQTQPAAPAPISPIYSQPNNGVFPQGSSSLPPEGSPEFTAAQTAYNASRNFPTAPAFNVNTTNTNGNVSAGALSNTGSNYGSAYGAYNNLAGVASKIFDYSQYSPEEVQAKQNLADLNSKILAQKFAATTQINDLAQNGSITKEQAQNFISETARRADEQSALLGISQNAAANNLGVLGDVRKTALGAYTSLAGLLQPTSVSPGSTLYNPLTGVNYQGTGAAPAQIFSTAQNLEQSAISQGAGKYLPDGTIDHNFYIQQAQQYYGNPGGSGMVAGTGAPATGNLLMTTAQALVEGRISPAQAASSGINPTVLFNAANQISMQTKGVPYNATQAEANASAQSSALAQNATSYRTLSNAQATAVTHLDDLAGYYKELPSTRLPIVNSLINFFGNATGSQALQSYNTTLQAARGEIAKVLAGGGAPSDSDKDQAKSVLPDNMSPGQLKGAIDAAKTLMAQKIAEYSNTSNVPKFGQDSQPTTGTVVQTKAGAINTNW